MASFKPLNVKKFYTNNQFKTADLQYWNNLGVPTFVKEFGAIDYVDFSPIEPYYFAVTSSVRVQLYNPHTKLVVKSLQRFQKNAYGGTFRSDGTLLAAGDEQGLVKLFNVASKNVLRLFKGHRGAVHRANFTSNSLNIVSFSDDKTVKLWDISTEDCIHTFADHKDYVRAGVTSPISTNTIISGSYDGKIKLYDTRTQNVQMSVEHGCPVESLLFLPAGGIFLSAGGSEICVWDTFAGCRLLRKLSPHHKTITCLRLASNGRRILSSSLDRHVKIFDVVSYQVVHTLNYSNAILSLGISADDQTVVTGMVDGVISIRNMKAKGNEANKQSRKSQQSSSQTDGKDDVVVDHVISQQKPEVLRRYDRFLRSYDYKICLDSVLKPNVAIKQTDIAVCVMQELIHRKGLRRAVAGRSEDSIKDIISFICRNICTHRYMRTMIDVAMIFLDVYEHKLGQFSVDMYQSFLDLSETLMREVEFTCELLELQGAIELIIAASHSANTEDEIVDFLQNGISQMKPASSSNLTSTV